MIALPARIAVIGGGAWGTALAANAARAGHHVTLWARDLGLVAEINSTRTNSRYLPGLELPASVTATTGLAEACKEAAIILLVVPAQALAATMRQMTGVIDDSAQLISCAKGIDRATGRTMSEIIAEAVGIERAGVLSGPSFAHDVASHLPTAVTIAASTRERALHLCEVLSNDTLRGYASGDLIGVEWGGALKNVLAIAAGITRGRRLGASAEAAVTTRGFAELTRIATALGAQPETMSGLSGLGDLILTCGSEKSRNFAYGLAIGKGEDLAGLKLAEGAKTARIASDIVARHKIGAPLVNAVADVLDGVLTVDNAIAELLSRPLKTETDA